jgi:cobalamin biosynthesis protein CobC
MLEHGGDLSQAVSDYNIPLENWLDLSTGINPDHYPIPPIPSALWQRLPNHSDDLSEAALHYYNCQSALPAAGSQAIIQTLPKLRKKCKVAMPKVMYKEHAHAWRSHGHTLQLFECRPDADALTHADVVLLCNPNNPTGQRFNKSELLSWHQQLIQRGAWLIVDEAFMDTTPEYSLAPHTDSEGLFVLRSLGKFFGLAGARVGFLLAHPSYLAAVQELIGPWSLTGASRYIATQALLDHHWQDNTRKTLISNSQKLQKMLTLYGLPPIGGTTLFQYITTPQSVTIKNQLAQHGVWIRVFNQPQAIRLGLPPEDGWDKLDHALKRLTLSDSSI